MIAREPGQAPQCIPQAMCGYAEEMEHAGVTRELRNHRHAVDRRGYRHQRGDASILGGDPDYMTAGIGDPP
jgi:hypothetical protein